MKVVLFCGGQGLAACGRRPRRVPKPMVPIGSRPVLWHVMKYYAHFGHTDFVLCLGYRREVIKEYFLHYDEALSNDFVLSEGGANVELLKTRHPGLADHLRRHGPARLDRRAAARGAPAPGRRRDVPRQLRRRAHRRGPPAMIARRSARRTRSPSFLAVRPNHSFHVVSIDAEGDVRAMRDVHATRTSGSTAASSSSAGDLRLHAAGRGSRRGALPAADRRGQLLAHRHDGFWAPMDTLKDKSASRTCTRAARPRGRSGIPTV